VARRLFWHVLAVGRRAYREPMVFDPTAKPGAILLWLASGRAELQLDSGVSQLRPGPFVWLCSVQQRRSHHPLDRKPYTVCSIRFGGPNLGAWLDELDAKMRPEFAIPSADYVQRAQARLIRIVTGHPAGWEREVDRILADLMNRLLEVRKPRSPAEGKLPAPILKVLDAIMADPDRAWSARELATLGDVSYSHLRHLFRETMRESIHSFLQQKRLDRARTLLAEGGPSVKEIAEKLHFGNEYYFSSFFKAKTGVSPTQFRKQAGLA
jgi:AraC-like DNA-binding protein